MKPKRTVLDNGLRVITAPMKGNPTVTALVLVEVGSHYENKSENGISHFLEHMCFKGTKRRPSASVISHELDALGAESNAFTWYEFTGYYAKSRAGNFEKLFDVIADVYQNSIISAPELEKEKGVIIEEIRMYEDLPMRSVAHLLDKVLYGDQPAGRSVLGTESIIRGMRRDAFIAYRDAHYVPNKTTVIVAGDITHRDVVREARRHFASLKRGKTLKKTPVAENQRKPNVGVKYKSSSQTHFQLGFRSIPAGHKSIPIVEVLGAVLGQGMSSRLFHKLREELGVCYYVRANTEYHSDHGKFIIASGVDTKRSDEVITVILEELKRLKEEPVASKELRKAKEYLIGNMLMQLESTDAVAEYYGIQEILRTKSKMPREFAQDVRKVTPSDVQVMAKQLFVNRNTNLAVIGPFKNSARFKRIIRL